MTILIANVIQSTDSFGQWLAKTNQVITVISSTAVTTNSNTAVGNAAITGTFSANGVSISNTGSIRIGTTASNSFINATSIVVQSSSTVNTVITDTGVYVGGTAFYTDVVMSLGNSVIRSSNITTDSFVLKNTLLLGNTYLSTMNANTNHLFAIDTIRAGDVEANVYIDRNGLQIRQDPTAESGFANAKMTVDTLWIKNINANTLTVGSINYTASARIEFPANTHFLGQNNYFRYGLTANAPLIVTSTSPGAGILIESTDSGASTGPDIVFRRSSSSPAAGDNLAGIYWQGRNSAATNLNYAQLISEIASPTEGTEGTNVFLTQKVAGADTTTLYINSAGYVGIGETSPEAPLHITSTGAGAGILIESTDSGASTGPDIVFRRTSASPLAGDNLAGIYWQGRNSAATNLNYAQLISEIASPTEGTEGTNVFLVQKIAGTDTRTLHINSAGNVGLGTASPSQKLHVVGGALITGTTTINGAITIGGAAAIGGALTAVGNITAYFSDKRLKKNIQPINDSLAKISMLNGVTFNTNELAKSHGYLDDSQQVGVIAQDVQSVLPEAVKLAPFDTDYKDGKIISKSGENYLTVQYEKIVPLLIEAIKELKAEIDSLKNGN